jgi:putative transposase
MPENRKLPQRRSVRIRGFDYAQTGSYFVTICAARRGDIFGRVIDGHVVLNELGQIIDTCWKAIPAHFVRVMIDESIIMPDHIHGILQIDSEDAAVPQAVRASISRFSQPQSGSLGSIVRSFKAAVTRNHHRSQLYAGDSLWQRGFYERVLRNNEEYQAIRHYIAWNPVRWSDRRPSVSPHHE